MNEPKDSMDATVSAAAQGNQSTLQVTRLVNPNPIAPIMLQYNIELNDGDSPEDSTVMTFRMSAPDSEALAHNIRGQLEQAYDEKIKMLQQAFEFKSAQLACAKGLIDRLEVVRTAGPNADGKVSSGIFTFNYYDDSDDAQLIHSVQGVECYVPFTDEEQWEWLRTMVGGNHRFVGTIKISLVNFTMDGIKEEFEANLQSHVRATVG